MAGRALIALAITALAWSLAVAATGRIDLRALGLPVVAVRAWPSLAAAAMLLGAALALRGRSLVDDLDGWSPLPRRACAPAAALLAAIVLGLAITFGAFVAGGSDSYCYVEQADRWASATIREPIDPGFETPWPNAALSLTPTGFVPSRVVAGAIAPICPAGLSLLMAVPRVLGAPRWSVFLVVPLLAALTVWASFLAGRNLAGDGPGLATAALVAASPVFLYQAMQPMSDIAATAWLTLALAVATGRRAPAPLWSGLLTGLAIAMRPNLLPVALPMVAFASWGDAPGEAGRTRRLRRALTCAVGLAPGLALVALTQWIVHGSPLQSGYGSLALLFDASHVVTNAARYPRWLVETHSWFVLAGSAAPLLLCLRRAPSPGSAWPRAGSRCRQSLLLAGTAAVVCVLYLPYVPFEAWWFLRFWLPAIPALIALSVAGVMALGEWLPGRRTPPGVRTTLAVLATVTLAAWMLGVARDRGTFDVARTEAKFLLTASYLADTSPADAVVLAVWHSGALRYHGQRITVLWDAIDPRSFDGVVTALEAQGRAVFLVLEPWERGAFSKRFAGASAFADLDWPPRAQIRHEVTVWALADRARYQRGERLQTAIIGDTTPR